MCKAPKFSCVTGKQGWTHHISSGKLAGGIPSEKLIYVEETREEKLLSFIGRINKKMVQEGKRAALELLEKAKNISPSEYIFICSRTKVMD